MSWWKHNEIREVSRMTQKNAEDIVRIEHKDLARIKGRQDVIERRLKILQQEVDVQQRNLV